MYLYGFTTFAGIDKVMKVDRDDLKFSVWDLLQSDDEYFLVLGNTVSFAEQYTARLPNNRELIVIYPKFVSQKYIAWIHWMVSEYYTGYKNVIKYFISQDVESLLKREWSKKSKLSAKLSLSPKLFGVDTVAEKGQTLIVYPDLWTMFIMSNEHTRTQSQVLVLHSSDTQIKKDKAFWQIKHGLVKYILTTHAEMFQDFYDLQSISVIHPYKRYYAHQQDPRYKTIDVLSYLSKIHQANIIEYN